MEESIESSETALCYECESPLKYLGRTRHAKAFYRCVICDHLIVLSFRAENFAIAADEAIEKYVEYLRENIRGSIDLGRTKF